MEPLTDEDENLRHALVGEMLPVHSLPGDGFPHHVAVIAAPITVEGWRARVPNAFALVPGLATVQLKHSPPTLIVVDDDAFGQGAWSMAPATAGEHLVRELREVRRWADTAEVPVVGVNRPLIPDVNLGELRAVAKSRLDPEWVAVDETAEARIVREVLSQTRIL